MRNYWIDRKVGRKLTIAKVTNNTDIFRMGRITTDKHELLWPISGFSEMYVPSVGMDVVVVDDKYYMGIVVGGSC